MRQKLLETDPENVAYQSYVGAILNNLGILLSDMGRIEDAKDRYEKSLYMRQKLLETDPENVAYQSYVGTTLNNLGSLLSDMGRIEDAKDRYEKSLTIYTEPLQYLTISKKSNAIIKLIGLNSEEAKNESNLVNKTKYLKETVTLCQEYRSFFIIYELDYERKLITEAGLSAHIDLSMINVRFEGDSGKRAKQYEKALQAVEKLSEIENDETVSKLLSSAACYLRGRKFVNEALTSRKPDLELLRQAVEQFNIAREAYNNKADISFCIKADMCFCIYKGLLKILEKVENLEEVDIHKLKEVIQEVIETLPENVDPNIKYSFENIPQIFEENDKVARSVLLRKLDEEIGNIEYKALEKLFGHVNDKIKDYFEEPFSPNLFYNNWKLRITFDAEKIKGKLTVKAGNTILFDQILSRDEIKDNEIEIDYLERKYIPQGKDVIVFETPNQKPVVRDVNYLETISTNKKTCVFLHKLGKVYARGKLRIAAVQLRYDVYSEDSVVKILKNEAYKQKVMNLLEAVKGKADIVVFPEFSIPFDYLEDIQEYANETGIIVFAGTHYITEENIEKYENLFASDFEGEDFRKNICPAVIPNSRIIHSEKMFGAKEERALFSNNGMKQGKLNHIFRLWDNLNLGVLICFEYLNDELRHRFISACDIILVPQTNPGPERFYDTAKNDLNNPLCAGNKACIMANGIFKIRKMKNGKFVQEKEEILGGSSGIVLTLDKDSNRILDEGIISQKEQFVLLATINLQYSAARDIQIASEPIKTSVIHIFEENEIRLTKEGNIEMEDAEEFLSLLGNINACTGRKELKSLI
jgi:tetratricopeptide (TPR) repeat protein/predicted amidohydrolase